ncbi:MAG: alpha-hydroxy acid oxidase [Planctomycetota bacterium]|nr:alpha-hydroxy acid oxidase [Planctomycetota bacterium]MDA1214625.1 alpha-hydroxy acid oxidase [Planctomycetota bacterium]
MDRRFFSKFLALGAGSFGFFQAAKGADDAPTLSRSLPNEGLIRRGSDNEHHLQTEPVNVYDFQALAERTLPRATYEYITTGSTDEITLRENVEAFRRIKMYPPLLAGVDEIDTSTTVLGEKIAMPICLAPVAGQNLYHPEGGLAAARGAAAMQTLMGVSSSIGHSVEEIAEASPCPKWFQLYVPRDRQIAERLVRRVEDAGYKAIILTVDLGERKDADRRNRFMVPHHMLLKHLQGIGFDVNDKMTYDEILAFNDNAWDPAISWNFFDWLRARTKLPILIKGVLLADDARHAVELGLDGIVVSNHGGRRLDGMPASIEQLPEVVDAVNGRAEILLDSGIRRGSDVFKAIALGAKAVLVGRAYIWALASDGEEGVTKVLGYLHEELVSAMFATGCADIKSINKSFLRM